MDVSLSPAKNLVKAIIGWLAHTIYREAGH